MHVHGHCYVWGGVGDGCGTSPAPGERSSELSKEIN